MLRPLLLPALVLLLPLTLSSCRYNFAPPIPKASAPFELPARVEQVELKRQGDKLLLHAALIGKFEPGYLSVQWFDGSRAIGQDTVWLDSKLREANFELLAPQKGAYRAALLFGGNVMRQVELYEVAP